MNFGRDRPDAADRAVAARPSMMCSVEPLSSAACTTSNVHSGCAMTLPPGYCLRNASICATVKRVWTEQWPFHRISFACFTSSGVSPPPISLGSQTTISSSGTPILYAVLRPRCWSGSITSFSPRAQAHCMTAAALVDVQTMPPWDPTKALMAADELM